MSRELKDSGADCGECVHSKPWKAGDGILLRAPGISAPTTSRPPSLRRHLLLNFVPLLHTSQKPNSTSNLPNCSRISSGDFLCVSQELAGLRASHHSGQLGDALGEWSVCQACLRKCVLSTRSPHICALCHTRFLARYADCNCLFRSVHFHFSGKVVSVMMSVYCGFV